MGPPSALPNQCVSSRSSAAGNTATSSQSDVSQKITALTRLTAPQLRAEWRRLHRYQPPRLSRDLLVRCIAYRIQELAYGGLSKAPAFPTRFPTELLNTGWEMAGLDGW